MTDGTFIGIALAVIFVATLIGRRSRCCRSTNAG